MKRAVKDEKDARDKLLHYVPRLSQSMNTKSKGKQHLTTMQVQ
jgi:hypothetical protein